MAEILPTGVEARVRNLQVHGKDVETAFAGQRVAVNLAGVRKADLTGATPLPSPVPSRPLSCWMCGCRI